MFIKHISDIHAEESRLDDIGKALDFIISDGRECDLYIITGDLFEKKSTPEERNFLAARIMIMALHCPVLILRGNHDAPGDLWIYDYIKSNHSIMVHEEPDIFRNDEALVLTLPYFDNRYMRKRYPTASGMQLETLIKEELEKIFLDFKSKVKKAHDAGLSAIFAGHLTITGAKISETQVLPYKELQFSAEMLQELGADYYALGHIHKAQQVKENMWYSGSIAKHDFGETEDKGYVWADVQPGSVKTKFVKIPGREMILIEKDFTIVKQEFEPILVIPDDIDDDQKIKEALIRYRYRIREEDIHKIDENDIRDIFKEAHHLKIERVIIPSERVRAPEICQAKTSQEKLDQYLEAMEIPLQEGQEQRLKDKLAQIEEGGA